MLNMLTPFRFAGILALFMVAFSGASYAYPVTLAWDPTDDPDLAGYIVYVNDNGSGASLYRLDTVSLDAFEADNPTYAVTGLKYDVNYCFAVTAYSSSGSESDFSNTACVVNGLVNNDQDVVVNALQERGDTSGGCFIESAGGERETASMAAKAR